MKNTILLVVVLAVLGGLFFIFQPKAKAPTKNSPTVSKTAPTPAAKTFELVVKNNKLVSGPTTLSVNQGDAVVIKITADVDGELHLHGYDKHIDFKKDQQGELSFVANTAGRFPYELEDTKSEIGALEVQPR